MRPRAAEVKAMTALLDAEHHDVEQLAREALALAWELLRQREQWCLVLEQPSVGLTVHGPGSSAAEVTKAIGKTIIAAGPEPGKGHVRVLLPLQEGEK